MKIIRWTLLLSFIVLFGLSRAVNAADREYPMFDFFWGYQYANLDTDSSRESAHGWGGSLAYNFNRNLGIALDVGGVHGKVGNDNANLKVHGFGIGPRFTARGERFNWFGHVMGGIGHWDVHEADSDIDFGFNVGGGLDFNITKNLGFRLFQADYVPARVEGDWSHNVRVQTGLVIRFGY
jgi:opacity protein-like surface antigen